MKTHYLVKHIVKVLDDFLFIAETYESCLHALNASKHLSDIINLPIAHHKTEGPTHVLTFLGIQFDTRLGIVSIPRDKIIPYTEVIITAIAGKKLSLRHLRSLTGKLAFVSQIIPVGRCFLRRLYLTIGISRPSSSIKLSEGAILDLKVWLDFLANYNAKELYASKLPAPSLAILLRMLPHVITAPISKAVTSTAVSLRPGTTSTSKPKNSILFLSSFPY